MSCTTNLYLKFIHIILKCNVNFLSSCLCAITEVLDIYLCLPLTEWGKTWKPHSSSLRLWLMNSSLRTLSCSSNLGKFAFLLLVCIQKGKWMDTWFIRASRFCMSAVIPYSEGDRSVRPRPQVCVNEGPPASSLVLVICMILSGPSSYLVCSFK